MKEHCLKMLLFLLTGLIALAACSPPSPPDPEEMRQRAEATAIAHTQVAELIVIAATAANIPSSLPNLPTSTFTPQASLPAIETPIPSQPAVSQPAGGSSAANEDCYRAQFVGDVTITDNTQVQAGQNFTKVWRLANAGTCPWPADTQPVYVDGTAMQGMSTPLERTIAPGETVDISVELTAPAEPGAYRGMWMLANSSGRFGLGTKANEPFWVQVVVQPSAQTGIVYNFGEHACEAAWRSAAANPVPCPGQIGEPSGFVVTSTNPRLENRQEDELGIWTNPNQGDGNWIAGTFPPYIVQPGDHFIADIGCVADRPGCNLDYRLAYVPASDASQLFSLGAWSEVYDGKLQRIDVDLSALAGQEIKLILAVAGLGPPGQNGAFWLMPQIRR